MKFLANIVLFTQLLTEGFLHIQNASLQCDDQCKAAIREAVRQFRYEISTETGRSKRSERTRYEPLCVLEYVPLFF